MLSLIYWPGKILQAWIAANAIIIFLLISQSILAQQAPVILERFYLQELEKEVLDKEFSTDLKPWIHSYYNGYANQDSILSRGKSFQKKNGLIRKLKQEHFIKLDSSGLKLTIDPVLYGSYGLNRDSSNRIFTNTRGVYVKGDVGPKFSFNSVFQENQAIYPGHVNKFIKRRMVAPGQGRVKPFKEQGYDYFYGSGLISYTPIKNLNIMAGHGKNFIGDGYRSMILSDAAFNYPFKRINLNFKKFSYSNIYAAMIMVDEKVSVLPQYMEPYFRKKAVSIHHLTYNALPWLRLGLTESTVWKVKKEISRFPDPLFFNPVIFTNTAFNGLNGDYNTLVAGNIRFNSKKYLMVYGQYVLDDVGASNKTGIQAGLKYYDAFGLKNLFVNYEINYARPFTYAHRNPNQSFSHFNQELAHPAGANFMENILIINYGIGDFKLDYKFVYFEGMAPGSPVEAGNDILLSSDLAINTFFDRNYTLRDHQLRLMYKINPAYNFYAFIGGDLRNDSFSYKSTTYILGGVRTFIENLYYDF